MKDVGKALAFTLRMAPKWKIRRKNIILWGGSAGGHIALLYTYSYDTHNVVSAVVTLGAPTKLDDRYSLSFSKKADIEGLLPLITGKKFAADTLDPAYRMASPYYGRHFKPSLLIHGEVDTIVSWLQAKLMSDELSAKEVPNQLFLIKNGWHGGEGASKEVADSLNITVMQWIRHYSK
jgi:acetyl esterase/lipase